MIRCSLVRCLISALFAFLITQAKSVVHSAPSSGQQPTTTAAKICGGGKTYDELTEPWRHRTGSQKILMGTAPIELTLQTIEFSNQPVTTAMAGNPDFCFWNSLVVGVHVSTAGEIFSFADGEGASRGGFGKMAADIFARLEPLMTDLPDDFHHVPPPDRRVLVILEKNGATNVRLYDTARLPDSIAEMIRLTGVNIPIITPIFEADRELLPEEVSVLGLKTRQEREHSDFLTVSPDGLIGVLHDFTTKTLTVYEGGSWDGPGLPKGGKVVRVIPESWQPPVYGGYWVDTAFTPDGGYLLVTWGNHVGAMLYDTQTWEPVTDPNLFPQHLKEYLHSADWSLAVAVNEAGEALVWDERAHRVLSKLQGLGEFKEPRRVWDKNGNRVYTTPLATIDAAAFSPDGTRVAIYSSPNGGPQFNVWDARSGQKLLDVLPVASGPPLWWNDGRWLVAPDSNPGTSEGIWNADTGHFLGSISLSGCVALESHPGWGEKLLQTCAGAKDEGVKVMEWSVEGVQKQLDAFARQIAAGAGSSE